MISMKRSLKWGMGGGGRFAESGWGHWLLVSSIHIHLVLESIMHKFSHDIYINPVHGRSIRCSLRSTFMQFGA